MSQSQLAEKMGYSSTSSVNAWVQGSAYPSAESLKQLSEVLDVSLDWLFGLVEEPGKPRPGSLNIHIPTTLRTASEQVVTEEGYSDLEDLVRALLREKTGVGRINSLSPKVKSYLLQMVDLVTKSVVAERSGTAPAGQVPPKHPLIQGAQE